MPCTTTSLSSTPLRPSPPGSRSSTTSTVSAPQPFRQTRRAHRNSDLTRKYTPLCSQCAAPRSAPSCRPSLPSTHWAPAYSRKTSSFSNWMVSRRESRTNGKNAFLLHFCSRAFLPPAVSRQASVLTSEEIPDDDNPIPSSILTVKEGRSLQMPSRRKETVPRWYCTLRHVGAAPGIKSTRSQMLLFTFDTAHCFWTCCVFLLKW